MTRNVVIAINGGMVGIDFLAGSLRGFFLGVGPNAGLTVREAMPGRLVAGDCNHDWFQAEVDEAEGATPLSVRITTPADAWCNFAPLGLPGYHIDPGKIVVLTYARKEDGCLEMQTQGL
ncbi:hypothetical protein SAMN04488503_0076 [Humidesulfovibrio mexicanus]|uniref:Uncharacterized protein n=1 Tax=Humidesulfovibrio mexicanus TaxID=147047 RepID=A0A239D3R2_9BACT|nr:hypothetical protein [Humidesulfovibrio mexicanus]SNS26501.1 hypothetical protein SAMN04488503_0076 [Humidesulfovibrio mexicanus]